jgi:uncharacterized protein YjbJ (UPF0337 family)
MSIADKAKNAAEKAVGQVKEAVGQHTGNADMEAEGKQDQTAAGLKDAGEELKDTGGKVADGLKDAGGNVKDALKS